MRVVTSVLRVMFYILFRPFWILERFIKRDPRVIMFGSFSGRDFRDNSKAFYDWVRANRPEYTVCIVTRNQQVFEKLRRQGHSVVMCSSFKEWRVSLGALWFITDHRMYDVNVYATNGARIIDLNHGMPIKKVGLDDNHLKNRKHDFAYKLFRAVCPYYNNARVFMTIADEWFKPYIASLFASDSGEDMPFDKIAATGFPRNDVFFDTAKTSPFMSTIKNQFPGSKIIFYLPTFRMSIHDNSVFNPFAGFSFDMNKLCAALEKRGMVFLYKRHPLEGKVSLDSANERFMLVEDADFDLYLALKDIDILITDYSSVYFDFLLLKKPVILAPFDIEYYEKVRGLYYDYNEYIQGAKARDWNELVTLLENGAYYFPSEAAARFVTYHDGRSCERVMKLLEADE